MACPCRNQSRARRACRWPREPLPTVQVAVVTGAGRGIGRETALLLAKNGVKTVAAARSVDELEETAEEVRVGMKVREVLKRLNDEGWEQVRMSGDHRQFKHPDMPERRVTVAGHPRDDIDIGTLKSIYEQTGWEDRP